MPLHPRTTWARDKLPVFLLCIVLALCAPLHGLASNRNSRTTPRPTALPQPTRDPNAETYDAGMPERLTPDMLVASAAILIEVQSGEVIFEKNADDILYPASTTKIMTALLTIQSMVYDDLLVKANVSAYAGNPPANSSRVPVTEGEEVRMIDLLYGMMLRSGNDAATALAEHIAGTEAAFAQRMNETAAFLGCQNTHFVNAHGYHDPNHYSTARDLAIIARTAMRLILPEESLLPNEDENGEERPRTPTFREVSETMEYVMPATNIHPKRRLLTHNDMINTTKENNRNYFADAIGIKTGFHSEAMYCFVGAAERDGVELISVVLHSSERERWTDTRRLMEYGFAQYTSVTLEQIYRASPREINISGFDLSDAQHRGRLELGIRPMDASRQVTIVGREETIAAIERDFAQLTQVRITRPDRAPVTAGEVMGYLTYFPENDVPVEYELYATRSIEARKDAPLTLEEIKLMTETDPNPLPPFSLEFLVVPFSFLLMLFLLFKLFRRRRVRRRSRKQQKRLPTPKTRSFR